MPCSHAFDHRPSFDLPIFATFQLRQGVPFLYPETRGIDARRNCDARPKAKGLKRFRIPVAAVTIGLACTVWHTH